MTDAEHAAALKRAEDCRAWLTSQGWPSPILADSGNGAHLLYRVDLPNDDDARRLVEGCLKAVALRFGDGVVSVDLKTGNAARIWKLYGTLACKGDSIPDRPHRLAWMIEVPKPVEVVPVDLLKPLAATVPDEPRPEARQFNGRSDFDLERWITDHSLPVVNAGPWNGGRKWILNPCPWNPEHTNRAAFIVQHASGAIAAGCHHSGCAGRGWKELRDLYEPEAGRRGDEGRNGRPQARGADTTPKIATVMPPQARRVDFPLELPDSVWRGVLRDYRDALARTTEASDSYHLFTFLACAGSVMGRKVFVRYGLSLHGNLYVCIVGPTAEGRKTTSLRHAERAIREVDSLWRVLRGLSSAEGLLSQIADPWEKRGKRGDLIASGGTNDKRLMVWLGELSSLLRKAKQDSVANIVPILAEAFDCPPDLHLPTRHDPIVTTEPFISLIAASTPSWLEDLQDRDVLGGFGNRFVYVLGPPKDPIPFPDPPDARLMEKVVSHIGDVLLWLPDSFEVTLTGEARDLWSEFYIRWKSQVWPDEMFGALVQRIPDVTLKIALLYAVLEKRQEIDADILIAAIDCGGYCVASAQRIFTDFHATRESKLEGRILDVLKVGPVKFGDLHRAVGGRYSTLELNRALDALVRSGQLWRKEEGSAVIYGPSTSE